MKVSLPVLIVGAGPTGLTLGCELARRGIACRVVEKAAQLFPGSRAKGLQPRTLEVFDDLGIIDAILASGAPFPPFRLYSGTSVQWERSLETMLGLAAPIDDPGIPYPRAWLLPQWRTDEILRDRFLALGGRLDLSTELVELSQDLEGVSATLVHDGVSETVRAGYLVGADGGRSLVRKRSGFTFEGRSETLERTLIGDVCVTGLEGVACHILTHAGDVTRRFSLWNLPGSAHFQLVASLAADEAPPPLTLEGVQDLLERRTGRADLRLHDLRWSSLYTLNVRMVDGLRRERILLAGDAAHVHSSAGGQGLNTGVQDAYNLGWKLAAVIQGAAPTLLDTYDEERSPVAAHVLGLSSSLHARSFRAAPGPTPAIYQLDLSYRASSLALDDRTSPGALRAGDWAPDARLADGTRLFDLFRGPHFTLLAFGGADAGALEGVRVQPIVGGLEGYDVEGATFVLVRPDGYLGAITASAAALRDHLRRLH